MIDQDQLAAFQELAFPYFTTNVAVYRAHTVPADITLNPAYDARYDYGDDELTGVEYDYPDDAVALVSGWIHSTPQLDVDTADAQVATLSLASFRCPAGSDIRPHDMLKTEDGREFVVADTNEEDSWPDMMRASLRRRE